MFKIKDTNAETIIRFNERDEWEFSIDNNHAVEVIKDIAQAIVNAQPGQDSKFYILLEE